MSIWLGNQRLDAGSTGANTSLSNLDEDGEARFTAKQDTISDLDTIRSDASAGASAATTISGYGDIVSHNASEFQPAGSYVATSKLQVVDSLPSNPDADTFYFVKE